MFLSHTEFCSANTFNIHFILHIQTEKEKNKAFRIYTPLSVYTLRYNSRQKILHIYINKLQDQFQEASLIVCVTSPHSPVHTILRIYELCIARIISDDLLQSISQKCKIYLHILTTTIGCIG